MYPNRGRDGARGLQGGNQWVGYDDVDIVRKKAELRGWKMDLEVSWISFPGFLIPDDIGKVK